MVKFHGTEFDDTECDDADCYGTISVHDHLF